MASEAKTVPINLNEVPRLFNLDHASELCARDIVAYIRGGVERNPWVPVILDTKSKPIATEELEDSAIYWKGYNDSKAGNIIGLSVYAYCVIGVQDLDPEKEDCGLNEIVGEYRGRYNIQNFSILVSGINDGANGESMRVLTKLCDYLRSTEREDVIFPTFIVKQNKKLANGLDIDPYAADLDYRRHHNTLDAAYLQTTLNTLAEQINPADTMIQDLDGRRTQTIKLLTTYLSLKHNLPPVYVASFIADYLRFEFFYPRTKLSLYERVLFMRRVPRAIGYISANQSFHCLAAVAKKLYPTPHYIFDLAEHKLVEDSEVFRLDNPALKFMDFRQMFPGSMYSINTNKTSARTSLAVSEATSDVDMDKRLVDMFSDLSLLVDKEPVFLSVKNSVVVDHLGKEYLLYCPEEFGLQLHMMSEYFGVHVAVVTEGEFYRLIDAQLEKAILERDRAATKAQASKALVARWKQWKPENALHPAIPLEVTLFMHILPLHQSGLSYYDKALRCSQDVLPIITSLDSPLRDVSPLFEEISLDSLRRDPQARYAINCFGTTTTLSVQTPVVPVTFNAFEQRGLL